MLVDATSASRGFSPAYLSLFENGELKSRVDRAVKILRCCTGCPRNCRVDRLQNKFAVCRTGRYKYWDSEMARKYSRAPDYPQVARRVIKEMYRQVGDLVLDEHGLAKHGLLIRHLVMPRDIAGTRQVMNWIAQELSPTTYVNLMPQYYPAGKVTGQEYAEIGRHLTPAEYEQALDEARRAGLRTHERIRDQGAPQLDR
jgi:uncharacterized Fe-S radical SAM superfamily protein PflX